MPDVETDGDRVLANLYRLREIGTYKTGVHRPTLSPDDMTARQWLVDQLTDIGHTAEIDGIANVIGRSPAPGRKLLAGSHLETQNHAGWLDGALGVVYALEAATQLAGRTGGNGAGVDVIAFADEEHHFASFMGSYSLVGELAEETIDAAVDHVRDLRLRDALAAAGLAGRPRRRLEADRYIGFLEAHIEQGDWLESEQLSIGIVTSIVSICQYRITISGSQNHAGTTRMASRRDAGAAAVQLCHRIQTEFAAHAGERTVWTVGNITLSPGAHSIIPGEAEVLFQFRDADPAKLDELDGLLQRLLGEANDAGPCTATLTRLARSTPAVMDAGIQAAIERAAERHAPGKHVRMPSGAGHDAQIIAPHLPTGMLFVPSIGGISHHYSENTSDEDIVSGARVYVSAAADLLGVGG